MRESEVRNYGRSWPLLLSRAVGSRLWDAEGKEYLDFFAGAGSLNYGHNPACVKQAVLDYVAADGPINTLDVQTVAREAFLAALDPVVNRLSADYRVQFAGPGGADAVEAALRLARLVTGRAAVVALGGAFHGMSLGARQLSDGPVRGVVDAPDVIRLVHEADVGLACFAGEVQRLDWSKAAAVFVEPVQAEGGVRALSPVALRLLAEVTSAQGCLLVVDDVQAGCGRTGPFFSFETSRVTPDVVCLSKSISGGGFPLALTLLRAEYDVWRPGEFSGTFRGQNLAFVGGAAVLREYWRDNALQRHVEAAGQQLARWITDELDRAGIPGRVRGHGYLLGIELGPQLAPRVAAALYDHRVLVETCGPQDSVVKLLPPLTSTESDLDWFRGALTDVLAGLAPHRAELAVGLTARV